MVAASPGSSGPSLQITRPLDRTTQRPCDAVADTGTIRSSSTRSMTVAFCACVVPSFRTTIVNVTRLPLITASGSTDLSISSCAAGPSSVKTQFRLRSAVAVARTVSPAYLTVQVTAPFRAGCVER